MKKRFLTVLTALTLELSASIGTGAVSEVRIVAEEDSFTENLSLIHICSVGLDMIVVPGDITAETISGIIADQEMCIRDRRLPAITPDRTNPLISRGKSQSP